MNINRGLFFIYLAIGTYSEASLHVELYFAALPIIDDAVHHFETYHLVRAFRQVLVDRRFVKLVDVVESVRLNAV